MKKKKITSLHTHTDEQRDILTNENVHVCFIQHGPDIRTEKQAIQLAAEIVKRFNAYPDMLLALEAIGSHK